MQYDSDILAAFAIAFMLLAAGCGAPSDAAQPRGVDAASDDERESDAGTKSDSSTHHDAGDTAPSCRPDGRLQTLYGGALDAIQRLEDGGRMQVRATGQIAFEMLVANRELYDASAREQLEELLQFAESQGMYTPQTDLQQNSDGTWESQLDSETDFAMDYTSPSGRPVRGDIYDLESFVRGPQIEYDMNFDAMRRNPTERNTWTVSWNERGPLHHLLETGPNGRVPNPFVVHASLRDLAMLASGAGLPEEADFGPLRSLLALRVRTEIRREADTSGDLRIQYRAATSRISIRQLVMRGDVAFDIADLEATDGVYRLGAPSASLDASLAGLSGSLAQNVDGPEVEPQRVVTNFDGASAPETNWVCPE